MIPLLDKILNLFEAIFGLAFEEGANLVTRYFRIIKKVGLYAGIAFLVAFTCSLIGVYIPIFASIGILLGGFAAATIVAVLIPLYIAVEFASDKFPAVRLSIERVYTIIIGTSFFAIYIHLATKHQRLYPVILCIIMVFLFITIFPGANKNTAIFNFRLNVLLTLITISLVGLEVVPHAFLDRHRYLPERVFGLQPQRIDYQLNDQNELISSSGAAIKFVNPFDGVPLVWYADKGGKIVLYDNIGFDPEGTKLLPTTPEVVERIKAQAKIKKQLAMIPPPPEKSQPAVQSKHLEMAAPASIKEEPKPLTPIIISALNHPPAKAPDPVLLMASSFTPEILE
ncbi:hypothetical protein KW791_01195 [Candidatus Parcubacteria bacterium]|nr:hypothetical protein [Candidatus Parcubacteria bacterium]